MLRYAISLEAARPHGGPSTFRAPSRSRLHINQICFLVTRFAKAGPPRLSIYIFSYSRIGKRATLNSCSCVTVAERNLKVVNLLSHHQAAVQRLGEVSVLGVDSAQQIIAEVGATEATFPSEKPPLPVGGRRSQRHRECGCKLQPPISQWQL